MPNDLAKLSAETIPRVEARLNGGPPTVNHSADNYGVNTGGHGPEGWFDNLVNSLDLKNLRRRYDQAFVIGGAGA